MKFTRSYRQLSYLFAAFAYVLALLVGNGTNAANPDVLALVSNDQATHFAINSGSWTNASVWQGGIVPGDNARIVIQADVTVVVDSQIQSRFKTIRVDGTLKFSTTQNTRLLVDTLVVNMMGHLEIGNSANPVAANRVAEVVFIDDGPIDLGWDPKQLSRGLLVMGSCVMHGAQKTAFIALSEHPTSGANSVELSGVATGWAQNDQICITGSQGVLSDEVRTIAELNGNMVQLGQSLSMDHVPPRADIDIYAANFTRNIRFSSENSAVSRRGHIMLMHTLDVEMDFVQMIELGRTDKSIELDDVFFEFTEDVSGNNAGAPIHFTTHPGELTNVRGRYALHFHRGGLNPNVAASVEGCVVNGSPGWGFVNHTAHVEFRNNVAHGVQGTAFYTETGDEIGLFDNNIAIRNFNPRNPIEEDSGAIDPDLGHDAQEFGNTGSGFWLSGMRVAVTNNIVTGATGHGIILWVDGLVEADRGRSTVDVSTLPNGHLIPNRDTIPVWWAPLADFSGNECANATIGFRSRYVHSQTYVGEGGSPFHAPPPQAYIDTLRPTISDLLVWGCRDGVMLNYCERMSLRNSRIVGIGNPFVFNSGTANVGAGLDLGTTPTRGPGRIENVIIEGFELGFVTPRHDQWAIENLTMRNVVDFLIQENRNGPRALTMNNIEFGSLAGTAVAGRENDRLYFSNELDPDAFAQPFWFVLPDRITLDGQGLYLFTQDADEVPLQFAPDPDETFLPIPPEYVGATNAELKAMFELCNGGALIPEGADEPEFYDGVFVGSASSAATVLPELVDMTNSGHHPEPPQGGPIPELTGNYLEICSGQTVVIMNSNLNCTDTDSEIRDLFYEINSVENGYFAHRNQLGTPIDQFSKAQVDGGVIRFVHDGSQNAPSYWARVTDGSTTTDFKPANVTFCGNDNGGKQSPVEFELFRGILMSGTAADIVNSDDSYLRVKPGFVLNNSEAPVWLVFSTTLASDSPQTLAFVLESSADTPGLSKTIEVFNWATQQYDVIASGLESFNSDEVIQIDLTEGIQNWVQPATGAVRSRVGWRKDGFVIVYPWTINVDQVQWNVD